LGNAARGRAGEIVKFSGMSFAKDLETEINR
jgi:hypothetical protein